MRKYITVVLISLVIVLAWKYFSLRAKIFTANCIALQARDVRDAVRFSGADQQAVLSSLDWYIGYYDRRTNELVDSGLLGLLRQDREGTVREAITYLRKNGTNNFGDDPYQWLHKEDVR